MDGSQSHHHQSTSNVNSFIYLLKGKKEKNWKWIAKRPINVHSISQSFVFGSNCTCICSMAILQFVAVGPVPPTWHSCSYHSSSHFRNEKIVLNYMSTCWHQFFPQFLTNFPSTDSYVVWEYFLLLLRFCFSIWTSSQLFRFVVLIFFHEWLLFRIFFFCSQTTGHRSSSKRERERDECANALVRVDILTTYNTIS